MSKTLLSIVCEVSRCSQGLPVDIVTAIQGYVVELPMTPLRV